MTIEEKLDIILQECRHHFGHLPIDSNWERICRLVTDGNGIDTGNPDFKQDPQLNMHIKYLDDEGYIYKFTNLPANSVYYVATTKGLLFEGFVNRKNRLQNENKRISELENQNQILSRRQVELNKYMVRITLILALIGIASLIWQVYKDTHFFCFGH